MSSISQQLQEIKTNLTEAGQEIADKLDSLDVVSDEDKAVVAELQERAKALADVVPNTPAPVEEAPGESNTEQPVDEEPVDEGSAFDEEPGL